MYNQSEKNKNKNLNAVYFFIAIAVFLGVIFFPILSQAQSTVVPTSPNPTSTIAPTSGIGSCPKKNIGDADCVADASGKSMTILDYAIWYSEFIKGCSSTNLVGCGADDDHNGYAMDANFNYPGTSYISTDNKVDVFDYAVWIQGFTTQNGGTITPTGGASPTTSVTSAVTPTHPPTTTVTSAPTPTTGGVIPTLPVGASTGLWISAAEIAVRPTSGSAWSTMKAAADGSWDAAELYNQDSNHDQQVLAAALVYAKTKDAAYRTKALNGIKGIIVSGPVSSGSQDGRSLGLGRNLLAYVLSADLIDLKTADAATDGRFRTFLTGVRTWQNSEGRSLIECHQERPNNWGAMCGASRIAADRYLNDTADLAKAVQVFKGFAGDRAAYAGFSFGTDAFSWMCDKANPRPINPINCMVQGHDLSGADVDDVRREGAFTWPPRNSTNYPPAAMGAAVAQAELLYRAGYDSFNWSDKAMLRGMKINATVFKASGSGTSNQMYWIGNYRYGAEISTAGLDLSYGKPISWTDWTHAK